MLGAHTSVVLTGSPVKTRKKITEGQDTEDFQNEKQLLLTWH